MKPVLLIALFAMFGGVASAGTFEGLDEKICPEAKEYLKNYESVVCKAANSKDVLAAKVGKALTRKDLKDLGLHLHDVITLGVVPDADSNSLYFYSRWLLNKDGEKVGVITYEGWNNEEMESSAQFIFRYNLKGELVSALETEI